MSANQPSEFSANVELERISVAAPSHRSYHSAAKSLLPGLKQLGGGHPDCGEAITLLAGFIAESILKAALSKAGKTAQQLYSHDLIALWNDAVACGAPLEQPCPDWVSSLNVFHSRPYYIRYHTGGGFYSLLPASILLAEVTSTFDELSTFCQAPAA